MKLNPTLTKSLLSVCVIAALPATTHADSQFIINNTTADAFLSANSPSLNYGGAGTLVVASSSTSKGRFDSIIKFNLASAVTQFNTTYGSGNWHITGLSLQLASNFGTQGAVPGSMFSTVSGGNFDITWLGYDNWVEGNGNGAGTPGEPGTTFVDYNSVTTLFGSGSDLLGGYTYTPPGNNTYANYNLPLNTDLVNDAAAGGDVSLYFDATDTQLNYLYNSKSFAQNHPQFTVTADVIPEPTTTALMLVSLGGLLLARQNKRS